MDRSVEAEGFALVEMGEQRVTTREGFTIIGAIARTVYRAARAAWAGSAYGPWRAAMGVSLAFGLPLLALAAGPHAAGAEHWQRVEALPAAGAVRQVAAGQRDDDVFLYAVIEAWGVYRSADGGRTWQQVDRLLPRGRWGQAVLGSLALAPDDPGLLLAAVDGPAAGGQPAIFKSADGGYTWLPRRGLGMRDVEALAAAPNRLAYAAGRNRLYRSADGGDTWLQAGRRPHDSHVLAMAVDPSSGVLYIGGEGDGIWLTSDRGASWRAALDGHTVYTIALGAGGRVYAGTEEGLQASADGGASWRAQPMPMPAGAVVALAVVPGASDRLFAATARGLLEYSPDGGVTWQSLNHTLLRDPVTALAVDPSSAACIYVGTQRGLWRCTLAETAHGPDEH